MGSPLTAQGASSKPPPPMLNILFPIPYTQLPRQLETQSTCAGMARAPSLWVAERVPAGNKQRSHEQLGLKSGGRKVGRRVLAPESPPPPASTGRARGSEGGGEPGVEPGDPEEPRGWGTGREVGDSSRLSTWGPCCSLQNGRAGTSRWTRASPGAVEGQNKGQREAGPPGSPHLPEAAEQPLTVRVSESHGGRAGGSGLTTEAS